MDVPQELELAALNIRGSDVFFPKPFVRLQVDVESVATRIVERLRDSIEHPGRTFRTLMHQPRVVADATEHRTAPDGNTALLA